VIPSVLRDLGRLAQERADRLRQRVSEQALLRALPSAPPRRPFAAPLGEPGPRVIAEIKRASPSRGAIRASADPAEIARAYATAGASCISLLTEPSRFGGDLADLGPVREASGLPVLMKDFVVDPIQLVEGRAAGADCALLIVALLGAARTRELHAAAEEIGLEVLVEVHDCGELDAALELGAPLIGVNSRDLHSLAIDLGVFEALAPGSGHPGVTFVAESGLSAHAELVALGERGYDGFLVGTHLMASPDPGAALRALLGGNA
jgi:indole-3-glycerol phosphate synthase